MKKFLDEFNRVFSGVQNSKSTPEQRDCVIRTLTIIDREHPVHRKVTENDLISLSHHKEVSILFATNLAVICQKNSGLLLDLTDQLPTLKGWLLSLDGISVFNLVYLKDLKRSLKGAPEQTYHDRVRIFEQFDTGLLRRLLISDGFSIVNWHLSLLSETRVDKDAEIATALKNLWDRIMPTPEDNSYGSLEQLQNKFFERLLKDIKSLPIDRYIRTTLNLIEQIPFLKDAFLNSPEALGAIKNQWLVSSSRHYRISDEVLRLIQTGLYDCRQDMLIELLTGFTVGLGGSFSNRYQDGWSADDRTIRAFSSLWTSLERPIGTSSNEKEVEPQLVAIFLSQMLQHFLSNDYFYQVIKYKKIPYRNISKLCEKSPSFKQILSSHYEEYFMPLYSGCVDNFYAENNTTDVRDDFKYITAELQKLLADNSEKNAIIQGIYERYFIPLYSACAEHFSTSNNTNVGQNFAYITEALQALLIDHPDKNAMIRNVYKSYFIPFYSACVENFFTENNNVSLNLSYIAKALSVDNLEKSAIIQDIFQATLNIFCNHSTNMTRDEFFSKLIPCLYALKRDFPELNCAKKDMLYILHLTLTNAGFCNDAIVEQYNLSSEHYKQLFWFCIAYASDVEKGQIRNINQEFGFLLQWRKTELFRQYSAKIQACCECADNSLLDIINATPMTDFGKRIGGSLFYPGKTGTQVLVEQFKQEICKSKDMRRFHHANALVISDMNGHDWNAIDRQHKNDSYLNTSTEAYKVPTPQAELSVNVSAAIRLTALPPPRASSAAMALEMRQYPGLGNMKG